MYYFKSLEFFWSSKHSIDSLHSDSIKIADGEENIKRFEASKLFDNDCCDM